MPEAPLRPPRQPSTRPRLPARATTDADASAPRLAELHAMSSFSFRRGASLPGELVDRALELGLQALALTDTCSVAGVVRAWERAREVDAEARGLALLYGAQFAWAPRSEAAARLQARLVADAGVVDDPYDARHARIVAIARDLDGWGGLCEFITACRRDGRGEDGRAQVDAVDGARASAAAGAARPRTDGLRAGAEARPVDSIDAADTDTDTDTDTDVEADVDVDVPVPDRAAPWHLLDGCECLYVPPRLAATPAAEAIVVAEVRAAQAVFGVARLWLAVELLHDAFDDAGWLALLARVEQATGARCVVAGDVQMHVRSRKPLHDVMTAIRLRRPVAECGFALQSNAERHLRAPRRIARLVPLRLVERTLEVAARCTFRLDEVRYHHPRETVPEGMTPSAALAALAARGAAQRYPGGVPDRVREMIDRELALIARCGYEMFFLTVADVVRFARDEGILCQGRGSAANSVVCFVLGITAVDPMQGHLLLERFISEERRHEPPDIDVDFEHERRERVIQYLYRKYGRDRAALAATVIAWRTRSALRDVGAALALPEPLVAAFAHDHHWFDAQLGVSRLAELATAHGVDPHDRRLAQWVELSGALMGHPRHLSQHVGGFVLTECRLTRLVPIENAAMPDRRIIEWDKDDLEALGMLKVDVLALGMLSALRRTLEMRQRWRGGARWDLADIPREDPATYAMLQTADAVGVFQVESRAQMNMLPRLRPERLYDLVVEVAIVRPGPIQGGMVHPYLKARERQRRGGEIAFEYPALKPALERTLGVPIFQEQVMQVAMIAAGFSAGEADHLRRAMAAWKRKGGVEKFRDRILGGMAERGYRPAFAQAIFQQMLGFGEYGFPESHAWSFALLTYFSAWLKCHEPACFLAALLNAQPMGFYGPSQLVQDARRHGIEVRAVDVTASDVECSLEEPTAAPMPPEAAAPAAPAGAVAPAASLSPSPPPSPSPSPYPSPRVGSTVRRARVPAPPPRLAPGDAPQPAVRLGFNAVKGLSAATAQRIVEARAQSPFADVQDLVHRARLDAREVRVLAGADALRTLAGHRRHQAWEAAARGHAAGAPLLAGAPVREAAPVLAAPPEGEDIVFDYASTGLTLRRHPLALLRPQLTRRQLLSAAELDALPHGRRVRACGIVTVRQQPQTANGTIFVTLEDETGVVNVIVWRSVREAQRRALLDSRLLAVRGTWQREPQPHGLVRHLVAERLLDLTPLLGRLARQKNPSRDFH